MKHCVGLAFFVFISIALTACGGSGGSPSLVPHSGAGSDASALPTPTPAPYYTMYLAGDIAPSNAGQVLEFSTTQLTTGNAVAPMNVLTDGAGNTSVAGVAAGPASSLYVAYEQPSPNIAVYQAHVSGTLPPTRTIDADGRWATIDSIALAPDGTLYVLAAPSGCEVPTEIFAFSATASGNDAAIREIAGSNTGLGHGAGEITVGYDGTLYFADETQNKVFSYAPDASGNVSPETVLGGSATMLNAPTSIAITPGGMIAVWNYNTQTATEYPLNSTGNVAPSITWSSPSSGDQARLMAVDNSGYFFVYVHTPQTAPSWDHRIAVFPPNVSGSNVSFLYVLQFVNTDGLFTARALAVQ